MIKFFIYSKDHELLYESVFATVVDGTTWADGIMAADDAATLVVTETFEEVEA